MRFLIALLAVLTVVVLVVNNGFDDPGYIILAQDPYVVRLPLLLFVLILLASFIVLYLLIDVVSGIYKAPGNLKHWQTRRREGSAQEHTMLGYAGLVEGNWKKAESQLMMKLNYNKTPLLNYLGAAHAAQQQGKISRRNDYIEEAISKFPKHKFTINLAKARLLYRNDEVSEAKTCLEQLLAQKPKNAPVLKMLSELYKTQGEWSQLLGITPELKKLSIFPESEIKALEFQAHEELLSFTGAGSDNIGQKKQPQDYWKSLPKAKQKDTELIAVYVSQLLLQSSHTEAEQILRKGLSYGFDPSLMSLYGKVITDNVDGQIKMAESFLKNQKDEAELYLALARLYKQKLDYETSKEYFVQAIEKGSDEAYVDYGLLLEQLGEQDKALYYIKEGVTVLSGRDQTNAQTHPYDDMDNVSRDVVQPVKGELVELDENGFPKQP